MPDITHLLQAAVYGYRSPDSNGNNGSKGLCKFLGVTNGILSRKVSPNDPGCHLSPDELVKVCQLTGDHSAIVAIAMQLGYVLMPINMETRGDVAPSLANTFKELGEWLQAAAAANAAPSLSENTIAELQRELFEGIAESVKTFSELKAKHLAQKPSHLRVA